MSDEWGPLGRLAGEWQGEGGLDTAYSHSKHEVLGTPYLEKLTFKPFGPVDNGKQALYGLDYKSAMWRNDEENPFHTEVGYWLWDGATGEIIARVRRSAWHRRAGGRYRGCGRHLVHPDRGARCAPVRDRREQVPRGERVDVELFRHDHVQRRR